MLTKILSGLLLVITIVVGINIFRPQSSLPVSSDSPSDPTPIQQTPDFLARLPLVPFQSDDSPLIAIVIENHEDARPFQKGLDHAVLIGEFLVEGFISRFVALFSATDLPDTVGPVRSLRPYFIDALSPWTSFFLYAGGSPDALETIERSTIPHINGLFFPEHFIRNASIAEPHNLFVPKNAILDLIKTSPLTNSTSLIFDRGPISSDQPIQEIRVNFFNPDHNVIFTYNPLTASYKRINGIVETTTAPQNILILEAPINGIGSYGRLDIPLHGTGNLLLFQSGRMTTGTWEKAASSQPFVFMHTNNQPLLLANGQIWMMVLETLERVKWE